MYVYVYVCMYVCMYIYIYILYMRIYIYIYISCILFEMSIRRRSWVTKGAPQSNKVCRVPQNQCTQPQTMYRMLTPRSNTFGPIGWIRLSRRVNATRRPSAIAGLVGSMLGALIRCVFDHAVSSNLIKAHMFKWESQIPELWFTFSSTCHREFKVQESVPLYQIDCLEACGTSVCETSANTCNLIKHHIS